MKRLDAICSLISPCGVFADIGTDHGYIALRAASVAGRVIASDISADCIGKARQNVQAENVEFFVGDGLSVLDCDPDMISICGMGGLTIVQILTGYSGSSKLILQPQGDADEVRKFLLHSGYTIERDFLVFERGRYYDILLARKEKCANADEILADECAISFGIFYKQKNEKLQQKLLKMQKTINFFKKTEKNIKLSILIDTALSYQ